MDDAGETDHMLFMHASALGGPTRETRGVSIWVDDADAARAQRHATQALAAAGWKLSDLDSIMETTADDYFRACPSREAFERARVHGIAWRFDDE